MSAVVALTAKVDALAAALAMDGPARRILADVVTDPTTTAIVRASRHAFGSDGRPFKNKPVSVTVNSEIKPTSSGADLIFKLGPTGFWVMGQYGAKAHTIGTKRVGGRLKAASHPHPVRGPIKHPGSRGKGAIDGAWKIIRRAQDELVPQAVDQILEEAWRG